jgi:glycosyltransferase involved in cell wall biosynthesis
MAGAKHPASEGRNSEPFDNERLPNRIAFCITDLDVGGAERFLVELATRIDRRFFEPMVFCLEPRPVGAGESLVARLGVANVPVCFLGARRIVDACRVLGRLRSELRRQRPALVQTFLWHANVWGPIAARRLAAQHAPMSYVPIVTGLRVAEPRRRWRRPLERWAGRWAARHVAVSEGVARFAREQVGLAAEKILVIPNGIDVKRIPALPIDPPRLGLRAGRRFLLFVGRLDSDDQKGAARLLEDARSLLNRLEEHDLVFVGDGPRLDALRRRAGELGVQDRIHWLGWRSDLPAIIAAAEMLVAPSRWEGMSNTVLEAMAGGKPVVALQSEGIAELLGDLVQQHSAAPQVVSAGDWLGFIDRIAAIAGDAELCKRLGAANRARAESKFRLADVVIAYERLYWQLIGGSAASFGAK